MNYNNAAALIVVMSLLLSASFSTVLTLEQENKELRNDLGELEDSNQELSNDLRALSYENRVHELNDDKQTWECDTYQAMLIMSDDTDYSSSTTVVIEFERHEDAWEASVTQGATEVDEVTLDTDKQQTDILYNPTKIKTEYAELSIADNTGIVFMTYDDEPEAIFINETQTQGFATAFSCEQRAQP